MITFKKYISGLLVESGKLSDEELLEKFKVDCAPFLKTLDYRVHGHLMYHGTRSMPSDWGIKKFKYRSRPKDSPGELHTEINKIFKKRFGKEMRNWLFCTTDFGFASDFGIPAAVFPIGKFEIAINPNMRDLTVALEDIKDRLRDNNASLIYNYSELREVSNTELLKEIQRDRYYFFKDAGRALEMSSDARGAEMMVECESYYLFETHDNTTFSDVILPYLKGKDYDHF